MAGMPMATKKSDIEWAFVFAGTILLISLVQRKGMKGKWNRPLPGRTKNQKRPEGSRLVGALSITSPASFND